MVSKHHSRMKAILELKQAIEELNEAIRSIKKNRLETAENEITSAVKLEAKAMRNINRAESKKK